MTIMMSMRCGTLWTMTKSPKTFSAAHRALWVVTLVKPAMIPAAFAVAPALQQRNAESSSLPRSCLRKGYDVSAFRRDQIGYDLLLNRHRLYEPQLLDGLANLLANT